jgi:alpha-glucosidase
MSRNTILFFTILIFFSNFVFSQQIHYDDFSTNTNSYYQTLDNLSDFNWELNTINKTFSNNRNSNSNIIRTAQIIETLNNSNSDLNINNLNDRIVLSTIFKINNFDSNEEFEVEFWFSENKDLNSAGYLTSIKTYSENDYPDENQSIVIKKSDTNILSEESIFQESNRFEKIKENTWYNFNWIIIKSDTNEIWQHITLKEKDSNELFARVEFVDENITEIGYFGFGSRGSVANSGFNITWDELSINKNSKKVSDTNLGIISNIEKTENSILLNTDKNIQITFDFLDDEILRTRMDVNLGHGNSKRSDYIINPDFNFPNTTHTDDSNSTHYIYYNDKIKVILEKNSDFSFEIYQKKNENWEFANDFNLSYNYSKRKISFSLENNELLYGLTNNPKSNVTDLDINYLEYGLTISNGDYNTISEHGKAITPYIHSSKGYGLLWDNTYNSTFSKDNSEASFLTPNGEFDMYFISGENTKEQVINYNKITQKREMFPKYSTGYMITRWLNDNEWSSFNTKEEYFEYIIDTYRDKNIPLDVLIFDYDWFGGFNIETDYDNSFTWDINENHFSTYQTMLNNLRDKGVKVVGIRKPRIDSINFPQEFKIYTNNPNNPSSTINPFRSDAREYYWNSHLENDQNKDLTTNDINAGIVGWWLDESNVGEYSIDFDNTYLDEKFNTLQGEEYANLFTNQWARAIYEGIRNTDNTSNIRTFNLSRNAYTGIESLSTIVWTGDTSGGFETLKSTPQSFLRGALTGFNYIGFDVSGFRGVSIGDPFLEELFVRWIQLATFSPVFRAHSHQDTTPRFPWLYNVDDTNTVEKISREFIQLRYKLIPYTYTYFQKSYETGISITRPLNFDFDDYYLRQPENQEVLALQYMFGDNLLVAPILENTFNNSTDDYTGEFIRNIYLPSGRWIDFFTYNIYDGNQEINYDLQNQNHLYDINSVYANTATMPVFQKENSIVVMYENFREYINDTSNINSENLLLRIFPGAVKDKSTFNLYEDDGNTLNYQNGEYTIQDINLEVDYENLRKITRITINDFKGSYEGQINQRDYNLNIFISDFNTISIDNNNINSSDYSFDTENNILSINLEDVNNIDDSNTVVEIFSDYDNRFELISPSNYEEDVLNYPELKIRVRDDNYENLDVYFYNADTNTLIGKDLNVEHGEIATSNWLGLEFDTNYSWYIKTISNNVSNTSEIFNFKTKEYLEWDNNDFNNRIEILDLESDLILPIRASDIDEDSFEEWFYAQKSFLYYNSDTNWSFEENGTKCGFETKNIIKKCNSISTGLIHYWPLDETSGNAIDYISDNNGTVVGSNQGVQGIINNAYEFSNSSPNTYIELPDNSFNNLFNGSNSFSISLFTKSYSEPSGTGFGDSHTLFSPNDEQNLFIQLGDSSPVDEFSVRGEFASSSWQTILNSPKIDLNTWYHLVITYNPGSGWNMYVDSNLVDTSLITEGIDSASNINMIGGSGDTGSRNWDGLIDDFRIYNRDINSTEVEEIYNSFSNNQIKANFSIVEKIDDKAPNKATLNYPDTNSTNNETNIELSVYVKDLDDKNIDVVFYNSDTNDVICQNKSVQSDTNTTCNWSSLNYSTTYNWNVLTSNRIDNNFSETWTFKTKSAPVTNNNENESNSSSGSNDIKTTKRFLDISVGEEKEFKFGNDHSITDIKIKVNQNVQRPRITIEQLKSYEIDKEIRFEINPVYKYEEITTNIENSIFEEVNIEFRVEKDWIIENDINHFMIALFRYSDENWEELETTFIEEKNGYYYYSAKSPGFSYFVISLSDKEEVIIDNPINEADDKEVDQEIIEDNKNQEEETEKNVEIIKEEDNFETDNNILIYGIILVFILILISSYFIYIKKNKPKLGF